MTNKKQNLSNDPSWYLQQFPSRLIRLIGARAVLTDSTIPEILVAELTAVANRLEKNPDAQAPELASFGDTKPWPVKHFPEALRMRLIDIATKESNHLWILVAREMTAVAEQWKWNP